MTDSKTLRYPPLRWRLYSVWYRHMRVYTRNILSNGFPPFVEPFIFLVGVVLLVRFLQKYPVTAKEVINVNQ